VKNGKVKPTNQPAEEFFYKAYNVSYWTMAQADAAEWLNTQFGTNVK
jgi:ribose transport system substrate-binding protein